MAANQPWSPSWRRPLKVWPQRRRAKAFAAVAVIGALIPASAERELSAAERPRGQLPGFERSSVHLDSYGQEAVNVSLSQPRRRLHSERCDEFNAKYVPVLTAEDSERATAQCIGCVSIADAKCMWCPLTQRCQESHEQGDWAFSDKTCTTRIAQDKPKVEDNPVYGDYKSGHDNFASECGARAASWPAWMTASYGKDWSSKKETRMDAVRCSQHSLGMPVSVDENIKLRPICLYGECCPWGAKNGKSTAKDGNGKIKAQCKNCNCGVPITTKEVGEWACMSAILRSGIRKYLKESSDRSQISPTSWDVKVMKPHICEIIRLHGDYSSSTVCQVDLYGIDDFKKLRATNKQANNGYLVGGAEQGDMTTEVMASIDSGPVVSFKPGAGKSGSGFCRTWDNHFKIKLGIKQSMSMDEPKNLQELIKGTGGAKTLSAHLQEHPESLLNRYYGLMKTKLDSISSFTLIMQDASYDQDQRISRLPGLSYTRYDLKGASRNLNKEQDADKQFCLINGDFKKKENDLMQMSSRQCWYLRKAVRADAAFLAEHDLIDYSIFMGLANARGGTAPDCTATPGEPHCFKASDRQYTISIIDYLNDMNAFKSGENVLYWGKFNKYDEKIITFTERICPSDEKYEENRTYYYICFSIGGLCIFGFVALSICLWLGVWPFNKTKAAAIKRRLTTFAEQALPVRYQGVMQGNLTGASSVNNAPLYTPSPAPAILAAYPSSSIEMDARRVQPQQHLQSFNQWQGPQSNAAYPPMSQLSGAPQSQMQMSIGGGQMQPVSPMYPQQVQQNVQPWGMRY